MLVKYCRMTWVTVLYYCTVISDAYFVKTEKFLQKSCWNIGDFFLKMGENSNCGEKGFSDLRISDYLINITHFIMHAISSSFRQHFEDYFWLIIYTEIECRMASKDNTFLFILSQKQKDIFIFCLHECGIPIMFLKRHQNTFKCFKVFCHFFI